MEAPPVGLRADADGSLEPRPERDGGPEAGRGGNDVDVQGGGLEKFLRPLDPHAQQPLVRGRPGLFGEAAREGSWCHRGLGGQRFYAEWKVEVGERPVERRRETVVRPGRIVAYELRLPSIAVQWRDR